MPLTRRTAMRAGPVAVVVAAIAVVAVVVTNATVPQGNAGAGPVDALLVLGVPAHEDGRPTREEGWRVAEAVREFQRGRAKHIILSGGAAANRVVEADAMATLALRMGVPVDAVLREGRSMTTMENIAYSQALMDAHGWRRVEVISVPDHLRRASVMLAATHLEWRVHPAPTPGRGIGTRMFAYSREALGTAILRWFGPRAELVLHAVAQTYRKLMLSLRVNP